MEPDYISTKRTLCTALDSQFSSKAGYAFLEAENMWLSLHIPRLEFLIEFHAEMISKMKEKGNLSSLTVEN